MLRTEIGNQKLSNTQMVKMKTKQNPEEKTEENQYLNVKKKTKIKQNPDGKKQNAGKSN